MVIVQTVIWNSNRIAVCMGIGILYVGQSHVEIKNFSPLDDFLESNSVIECNRMLKLGLQ